MKKPRGWICSCTIINVGLDRCQNCGVYYVSNEGYGKKHFFRGRSMSVREIAEELNMSTSAIYDRIRINTLK